MSDDELLEFNFEGVDPAAFGGRVAMPKGEYNLQCTALRKYYKGDKGGTQQGDNNHPGLEFTFAINNHPMFTGQELKLWHPMAESNKQFLLNTLMAVIPGPDWQKDGIKIPLSGLIQQAVGRPCNGLIDWEINVKDDQKYVNNKLQSVKPFDQGISQPMPTEGNPPVIIRSESSAISRQAAGGVSKEEVNEFLGGWDQSSSGTPAATPPSDSGNFFDEPF